MTEPAHTQTWRYTWRSVCPWGTLPDGVLVHRALYARVAETPEALCYQLQAGSQMFHLGRIPAGQLNSERRSLQDIQDSLEDGPGSCFSRRRQKCYKWGGWFSFSNDVLGNHSACSTREWRARHPSASLVPTPHTRAACTQAQALLGPAGHSLS